MTDKPLASVWADRDLPVLAEVTRRIDTGERPASVDAVAQALGMTTDDVELAGAALLRRGYVQVHGRLGHPVTSFADVAGSAYLVTGLHPDGDDALSRLISVLAQAADRESDPDERGRLRKAANGLAALGGQVGAGVMTAYLTGMLPGH